jgi:hypothetical protein
VSVALEHTGPEAARPYVEQANTRFPTVVDEHGITSTLFGFKVVPNGVLVDEEGTIRYVKLGGFSIDNPDDVAAVEHFLTRGDPGASPASGEGYELEPLERELVETKLRLGRLLDSLGRRGEAVSEWRAALRLDPENFVIRKQIWAALHPERFHPAIDWDWQREQLERERREEIAAGVCTPDGCPLPREERRP